MGRLISNAVLAASATLFLATAGNAATAEFLLDDVFDDVYLSGAGMSSCGPVYSDSTRREVLGAVSLRAADLNGDGNLDFITMNQSYTPDMSVFLGLGDGRFGPEQRCCHTEAYSPEIHVGDLDSDGIEDVLAVLPEVAHLAVFWGRGDGTFETRQVTRTTQGPHHARIVDLDCDGREDVVYTTDVEPWLTVIWGDGTRILGHHSTFPVPFIPTELGSGDVNGDGRLDLVVTSFADSCVYVLPGAGNREFGWPTLGMCFSGGAVYLTSFILGDLNGDPYADIVASVGTTMTGMAVIGLGGSNGRFHASVIEFPGEFATRPRIADLDDDGCNDFVVVNLTEDDATVMLGNGDGSFRYLTRLSAGWSGANSAAPGDFNNDGTLDLLLLSRANIVAFWPNRQQVVSGSVRFTPFAFPQRSGTLTAEVSLPPVALRPWDPGNVRLTRRGKTLDRAVAAVIDSGAGLATFTFDPRVLDSVPLGDNELTIAACDSTGLVFHATSTLRVVRSRERAYWQVSPPGRLPVSVQVTGLATPEVTYRIFDCRGRLVRHGSSILPASGILTWDAMSGRGAALPSGVYLFLLDGTTRSCKIIVLR